MEARLARLAMELEAQPQEAKQAPVRVVRERAAEAVAEVEALQLGAKRVSERGAQRQGVKPG